MNVSETIPGRPRSFDELLDEVRASPDLAHRLVKTMLASGYLTDGLIFSLLGPEERRAVRRLDELYSRGSAGYNGVPPFDVDSALPEFLGPPVEEAAYAGRGARYDLVLLRGPHRETLVEVRSFSTLLRRHPNATWYFSKGRRYAERPVVLLEAGGFRRGLLLGAASPVRVESWVPPLPPPAEGGLEKIKDPSGTTRYVECR